VLRSLRLVAVVGTVCASIVVVPSTLPESFVVWVIGELDAREPDTNSDQRKDSANPLLVVRLVALVMELPIKPNAVPYRKRMKTL